MVIVKIGWGITAVFSVFAALVFVATMSEATGAPQEAAGAAIALALVVIPYVLTRCLEGLFSKP